MPQRQCGATAAGKAPVALAGAMRKPVVVAAVLVAVVLGAFMFWLFPSDLALLSEGSADASRRNTVAGFIAFLLLGFMMLGFEWDY